MFEDDCELKQLFYFHLVFCGVECSLECGKPVRARVMVGIILL
jgi:hypothetical protein